MSDNLTWQEQAALRAFMRRHKYNLTRAEVARLDFIVWLHAAYDDLDDTSSGVTIRDIIGEEAQAVPTEMVEAPVA